MFYGVQAEEEGLRGKRRVEKKVWKRRRGEGRREG